MRIVQINGGAKGSTGKIMMGIGQKLDLGEVDSDFTIRDGVF